MIHPDANLHDHTAGFMTGGFAGGRGPLPIVGMQIAAANASDLGVNDHIIGRGRDPVDLLYLDFPDAGVDSSFHSVSSLLGRCGCARGQSKPREFMAP